ncbi:MAG: hypothetical protein PHG85_06715 [Candidatus Altiarchaeota archaeon]|nr:hypothetical protein [Candidatus Altiarchaeota archaeon]
MLDYIKRKWSLSIRVIPIVGIIILFKLIFHHMGWEYLSVNPLFSGLVAASVFLLGFLISGVLVDYKEGEKLPGEMTSSLEAIFDETWILYKNGKAAQARGLLQYLADFTALLKGWFYKKEKTRSVLDRIFGMNEFFAALDPLTKPNFIVRMKQEQANIRRIVIRIHGIRETSFVSSGYAVAEAVILLLTIGLLMTIIGPFYESLFVIGIITFLLVYMLALIKDLDNPFDYYEKEGGNDEVSLKPLEDLEKRLRERLSILDARTN